MTLKVDIEITIILFHFPKSNLELRNGVCIFIWFDGKCQNGFECDLLKKRASFKISLELFRKCKRDIFIFSINYFVVHKNKFYLDYWISKLNYMKCVFSENIVYRV